MDLLSKSYEQFVAESSHLGLHKNALQMVYKEYEEQRLGKIMFNAFVLGVLPVSCGWISERLHSARLERERVIKEQQLEHQMLSDKTRQSDRSRLRSVTLPVPASTQRKPLAVKDGALKKSKTTKKTVNQATRSSSRSASLPTSDTSQPSATGRLPSVAIGLPEKVVKTPLLFIMLLLLQDQRILQAMAQKMNSEQEQEEIRKMAAKLWHEEVLLEQASKQVMEKQRREQLEHQKRINEKKVNGILEL